MADLSDFKLSDIEIKDNYSLNLYEKDTAYLLSIDENRLLAGFHENAGLKTRYIRYGGWENSLIGGHTLGHYMTAAAQCYINAVTSEENRRRIFKKLGNIVDSLAECQKHSRGRAGFIFGAKMISGNSEEQFDNVEKNKTNIMTEAWVPWYTMHKIIAGLISIYNLAHIEKAKDVLNGLCDWVYARASKWDEKTIKTILAIEYGGMNDCLYNAYKITKNPNHLYAAHIFDEVDLFEKVLSGEKDVLDKLHANTTIPKFLGALNRYTVLKEERYLNYAKAFFALVRDKHSYVTGGVGEWEHFGKDNILDGERTQYNCETCASYNMMIMARELFKITRDKSYADYYDEAYINSILPAMNPETGMAMYFQPMAAGFFKTFSSPYNSFWCCTGTGMEDFTKLADSAYFTDGENIYVNQYISSLLALPQGRLEQKAEISDGEKVEFIYYSDKKPIVLLLRIPDYANGKIKLNVCGKEAAYTEENGYIRIELNGGEKAKIYIPISVTAHALPDNKSAVAFKYGKAVLAAKLSTERMDEGTTGVDVTVPKRAILSGKSIRLPIENKEEFIANPDKYFKRKDGEFILEGADREYEFVPYYSLYGARYGIYWYIKSVSESADTETEREIIDTVQPGYGQYENDALHDMQEEKSVGCTSDGTYRYALNGGYFEYRMKVEKERNNYLIIYFAGEDEGKHLTVTADGDILFDAAISTESGKDLTEMSLLIPKKTVNASKRINAVGEECDTVKIRFSSQNGDSAKVREFIYIAH